MSLKNKTKTVLKRALGATFLLVLGVLVFHACNNPHFLDELNDAEALVRGELYRGVSLEKNTQYGDMLSFSSLKDAAEIQRYLMNSKDEKKDEWERGVEFSSLRTAEKNYKSDADVKYQYPEYSREYPDKAMSTILNPGGYVKIAGKVYHDTKHADIVYVLEGSDWNVYSQPNSAEKAVSCYRGDAANNAYGNYCGNFPTSRLQGYIDHYTNYLTTAETLTIYTYYYVKPCNSNTWWSYANASQLGVYYTYDILVDGVRKTSPGTPSNSYGTYVHSQQIANGWDICIGYVYGTHTGGGLTTYTRSENL